jgi:DNA-binding response OmpR family regulator
MMEQHDLFIALHDGDEMRNAALKSKLSSMGHQTVVFPQIDNVLEILGKRQRFDLLIAPLQDDLLRKFSSSRGEELSTPALFLVDRTQWKQLLLRNEGLEQWHAIDSDILRTANEELDWRIRMLLARRGNAPAKAAQATDLAWGDYRFLEHDRMVLHRDREVFLQQRQFDFALKLFRCMGHVVTRDWLRSALWRSTTQSDSRVVDVCAANVRRKLALCEENGFALRAVYGEGYVLSKCIPIPMHG